MKDLRRALGDHRLERQLWVYLAPKLLVIDEFRVWPYDPLASTALLALLRPATGAAASSSLQPGLRRVGRGARGRRHRHGVRDRLLHHGHVINIRGDIYRLRAKKRAGVFGRRSLSSEEVRAYR